MFLNEQKRINAILKESLETTEKALEEDKEKNRLYLHDILILLKNAEENREQIKVLENNVEFLTNNLSNECKILLN
jgi:hypothetical protein